MKGEEPFCPNCGSHETAVREKVLSSPVKIETQLVICRQCRLSFVFPRPPAETENDFYQKEYFERAPMEEWNQQRLPFFAFALRLMESKTQERRLLDVGCGGGFFLELAQRRGWKGVGVELSHQAVQYGRQKLGLEIVEGSLSHLKDQDGLFDAVTLWNVLDQMTGPDHEMKQIAAFLRPGGLLALRVTNLAFHLPLERFWKFAKRLHWIASDLRSPGVFHGVMFDAVSVRDFLKRRGFYKVEVLNAPLDEQSPMLVKLFGRLPAKILVQLCWGIAEILRRISGGLWIFGPSLMVTARRKT